MLYAAASGRAVPGSSKHCGRVSQSMAKCAGARLSSQQHLRLLAELACLLVSYRPLAFLAEKRALREKGESVGRSQIITVETAENPPVSSKIDSSDQHQARVLPGTQVLPASPARRRRRSRDGLLLQQAR